MIDEDIAAKTARPVLPWVLVAGLVMLAAGLLVSPWFDSAVRTRLPGALQRPDIGAVSARVDRHESELDALETRLAALETRPAAAALAPADGQPALNEPAAIAGLAGGGGDAARVAQIEARIEALDRSTALASTRIDNLSAEVASLNVKIDAVGTAAAASIASAATSAEKARGVLLVTAARRAAEQGQSLAVLEPALRRQFSPANTVAVEKLLSSSRGVPTLDALRQRFERMRPALADAARPTGGSWWERFKSGVADIVEVRRAGSAASRDADAARLADMSVRLKRGDVAGALVQLHRLPAAAQRAARDWRIDAESYAATFGALQQLEAAVLLEDDDLPLTAEPAPPPSSAPSETL